jgi:hypothetical protein
MSEETKSLQTLVHQAQLQAAIALENVIAACIAKATGENPAEKALEPSLPHAKFLTDFLQLTIPLEKKTKAADDKGAASAPEPALESATAALRRTIEELIANDSAEHNSRAVK